MPVINIADAPSDRTGPEDPLGAVERVFLGEAGGLSQYGVVLETLAPGAWSSNRHWHEAEDEFLWMLDGTAVLADEHGEAELRPGEAVAWKAGVPNAHHIRNCSDAPVRYLVAGWRAERDVVHYPDIGRRAVIAPDGSRTEAPEAAAAPPAGALPRAVIDRAACPVRTGSIYPAPYGAMMAGRASLRLGQAGGLTRFGANLVMLEPGAMSSLRHWHAREDEFVMVTDGDCTLVDDAGEHVMRPGACAAFPAGDPNGHHVVNRTDAPAAFLVVGSKMNPERATYSDVDLVVDLIDGAATFSRKDGTPYQGEQT